jgi:hypothetical protein
MSEVIRPGADAVRCVHAAGQSEMAFHRRRPRIATEIQFGRARSDEARRIAALELAA